MPTIGSNSANITAINMTDTTAPANPDSGENKIYFKSGTLYKIDSSGTETAFTTATNTSGWFDGTGTWTYSSADAPTFVIATSVDQSGIISVGMKIKLTQTTAKYFIVTAIDASTITVYGGTDYTLANAAITTPQFSLQKTPYGFPTSPIKWTVELSDANTVSQATPAANTWYNAGTLLITIPIGAWSVTKQASLLASDTSVTAVRIRSTLSTANNSESDADFTTTSGITVGSANLVGYVTVMRQKFLLLAAKTVYYLNIATTTSTADSISVQGANSKTIIRAVCAYL